MTMALDVHRERQGNASRSIFFVEGNDGMTIDIERTAALIIAISAILTPFGWGLRKIYFILRRLESNYEDICSSKEERSIIVKGILACLRGLEEQGCNGPVKRAIVELEDHMIKQSHR